MTILVYCGNKHEHKRCSMLCVFNLGPGSVTESKNYEHVVIRVFIFTSKDTAIRNPPLSET